MRDFAEEITWATFKMVATTQNIVRIQLGERKRRYKAAFIAKLSDSETEASEMQCWLDFSLKAKFMGQAVYEGFDKRYERIIGQLVTMIDGAEKWCR